MSMCAENFDATVQRMLPLDRLESEKDALRAAYESAKPYPHLVIDGLWDPDVLDRVVAEFPHKDARDWTSHATDHERKETSRGIFDLAPFTQTFFTRLCSPEFLRLIGEITGCPDLVADPLHYGGGLHESQRGGWLNLHVDWRKHPMMPLRRKLNMIIYLNRDWDPTWSGAIELWAPGAEAAGAKVDCIYNRTVVFPTTDESWHGFPTPISCPEDRSRKSLSMFYWDRSDEVVKDIRWLPGRKNTRRKALVHSVVPPIVWTMRSKLRARKTHP